MSSRLALLGVVAAALAGVPPRAAAQALPVAPGEDLGGAILLAPAAVDGDRPLFAPPGAAPGAGLVAGAPVSSWGTLGVGFSYLRPLWTDRDFTLAVPAGREFAFPIFGDTGNVDAEFTFAPQVSYHYRSADLNLGVRASGTFLSLSGRLDRAVSSTAGGVGELTATSTLTIVSADLVEVTRRLDLDRPFDKKQREAEAPGFLLVDLGLGTRLASISQHYESKLVSATGLTNTATRYSNQTFAGFGLTGAVGVTCPLGEDLVLFSNTRASVLIGENNKDSTLSVVLAGAPGQADTLSQSETDIIPVVEMEVGAEWGQQLAARLIDRTAGMLVTLRVALVGQFWGDVGPLSAGSVQGFRDSHLFLVGASVLIGLHH